MTELEAKNLRAKYAARKIFTQIPGWITFGYGLKNLKGSKLTVLTYICSKADNDTHITRQNTCTHEKIHLGTGVSLGTISGIVTDLVMQGIICRDKEGRNNIYTVQFTPPDSWPLHWPTNAARVSASSGRCEVLKRNCSQHQSKCAADIPNPLQQSLPTADSDYSDSGLYKDTEDGGGTRLIITKLPLIRLFSRLIILIGRAESCSIYRWCFMQKIVAIFKVAIIMEALCR